MDAKIGVIFVLFNKEDEGRVQEFIAELRSMKLTVEGMVEDYDRLIALYDISFFFRIYLRSCAQALHDRASEADRQSSLNAARYIQFFETELTTMPRMIYLFQSAYGSRFVRSVYQASYLTFIERQQQATEFLKKCVAEHDKFGFFRKTIATIEDNQLIEEPKILNPRIKGKPHNRPLNQQAQSLPRIEESEQPARQLDSQHRGDRLVDRLPRHDDQKHSSSKQSPAAKSSIRRQASNAGRHPFGQLKY